MKKKKLTKAQLADKMNLFLAKKFKKTKFMHSFTPKGGRP